MQIHVPVNILVLIIAEKNDAKGFVYAYMSALFLLIR